ncbi:Metallo-hydrolase/oxidoreductase [Coniochaeta ligniaria NRRL 30616]|uniref:Metallo-hydrolase/oxidoreductase n=1 Tax=Coniochaeta ligniaria NRRL 30616 TaxID=1408157 RepID=A0A1J7JMT9_9PEZI|nr:Metallo-hydrolase/oxidoreductase [Coniochaeta ligniaria NRRL 30616]
MATLYSQHPTSTPSRRPGSTPFIARDSSSLTSSATVKVYALSAGHFSLPEEQFVSPSSPGARHAVPSLCFLIQHACPASSRTTSIVFDLGLRRDIRRYPAPIQEHLTTREPYTTDPDVVKSLKAGGLTPDDIDYVIYSHVHWDHVGEPRDFTRSTFVVGHGSLDVLQGKSAELRGNHSHFESDLLDISRTIELSDPKADKLSATNGNGAPVLPSPGHFSSQWQPLGDLPSVLDIFQDGSVYIVNAPGHLPGHINLLAHVDDAVDESSESTGRKWIYLAGDACHDRRILRREKEIGEWHDVHGQVCCIHADRAGAEETIERIRGLERQGVEVIFAHDVEWENDPKNKHRFFGVSEDPWIFHFGTWKSVEVSCLTFPTCAHAVWGIAMPESAGKPSRQCEGRDMCSTEAADIDQTTHIMASEEEKTQQQLEQRFTTLLGRPALHSGWSSLLRTDPVFFSASLSLAAVPRQKAHLSPKHQALIGLAVDCAATHLYPPGIRVHISAAAREGATVDEVLEVIELSSTLGIHACNIGVPLLVEVMREVGGYEEEITRPFDERREGLKRDFTERRGYWHVFWEDFLRLDPEFFEAYLEFSGVPWVKDVKGDGMPGKGALEPKMKELVYCAFDCAATHLYTPGLKLHMKNALGYGATPQEILEVLEIATLLSIHTAHVSAPIVEELMMGGAVSQS